MGTDTTALHLNCYRAFRYDFLICLQAQGNSADATALNLNCYRAFR